MKRGTEATKRFNSTRDDLSAPGGGVSFMFALFSKGGGGTGTFVRTFSIGSNRVVHSGIQYVFRGEKRMCGEHV